MKKAIPWNSFLFAFVISLAEPKHCQDNQSKLIFYTDSDNVFSVEGRNITRLSAVTYRFHSLIRTNISDNLREMKKYYHLDSFSSRNNLSISTDEGLFPARQLQGNVFHSVLNTIEMN